MKNKTKIVIGAGILSMSLCTVIGTGVVNFGKLLAENQTQVAAAYKQSFKDGDRVIIGGYEFTLLDTKRGTWLSQANVDNETTYDQATAKLNSWEFNATRDRQDIVTTVTLPAYTDIFTSNIVRNPRLGNGTKFWTKTPGESAAFR